MSTKLATKYFRTVYYNYGWNWWSSQFEFEMCCKWSNKTKLQYKAVYFRYASSCSLVFQIFYFASRRFDLDRFTSWRWLFYETTSVFKGIIWLFRIKKITFLYIMFLFCIYRKEILLNVPLRILGPLKTKLSK